MTTRIVGSYLSPYVRKVLVCLELKGVAYEIDPIVPFFGDDEFARVSPLRRIPVLIDDDTMLCDSTVICEYLEERYGAPALLPRSPVERARARWLEEFADTRMGEVFIWRYFNQLVIRRGVWGEKADEEMVREVREKEIPQVLDYLEGELPASGFFFGEVSLPDIAVACFLRNAAYARYSVDAQRWPKTAAHCTAVWNLPAFEKLKGFEEPLMRTPIANHREVLRERGAPLSAATFATHAPRRGVMRI